MGLFNKRTEAEVQGGNAEWAEVPGTYVVEVISAYDSNIVYPEDKKTRHIGLRGKIVEPIQMDGEADDDFEDRQEQIGRLCAIRVYLSEKTAKTAFKLLTEIAGEANPPDDFMESVFVDTVAGEPQYNLKEMADRAPLNPGQLIGRRFLAALESNTQGGQGLRLNMFQSWYVDEDKQVVTPNDLFEGEDEVSEKIRERVARKNKKDGGRTEGLKLDIEDEETVGADDELPF